MKKFLGVILAFSLAASLAVPALAHGGRHSAARGASSAAYAVCALESCTGTGIHYHSGRYYEAHHVDDGHTYHAYCRYEDCQLSGYHSHDGVYCFGHMANDGHNYHSNGKHGGRHH